MVLINCSNAAWSLVVFVAMQDEVRLYKQSQKAFSRKMEEIQGFNNKTQAQAKWLMESQREAKRERVRAEKKLVKVKAKLEDESRRLRRRDDDGTRAERAHSSRPAGRAGGVGSRPDRDWRTRAVSAGNAPKRDANFADGGAMMAAPVELGWTQF